MTARHRPVASRTSTRSGPRWPALAEGAPLQFDDIAGNIAASRADSEAGEPLDGSTHVVRLRMENQRVANSPIEGNAILAQPTEDGVVVHVSTQQPHVARDLLAGYTGLEKQVQYGELGLDRDGRFTGLRVRVVADCGAYAGFNGNLALGPNYMMAQGPYELPQLRFDAIAALTNTSPVGMFRARDGPRPAPSSSVSSTWPPTSSASPLRRSAGAT